jgi:phosphohistidine phosphatase
MKKLLIIRHAKSSWDDPYLDDHQRPLASKGLRDMPKMAHRLKAKNIFPDMIYASDAVRAKSTALLLVEYLAQSGSTHVDFSRDLFHASHVTIMEKIHSCPDAYTSLAVVGHNPGLNELIWSLGQNIDNLPTSGIFGFTFETDSWKSVSRKNAEFWFFDYPKKVG